MVVILGESCNGLSFARSLGRRGIPTLMLASEGLLGAFTRYGKVVMLPCPDRFPHEWVAFLEFVGSRLHMPGVLFAASDVYCLMVSRHREALQRHFRFVAPDPLIVERTLNKRCQYETARSAGVPTPTTHFPDSRQEASRIAAELSYPCILKPYMSRTARAILGKQKVLVVHSKEELIAAYEEVTRAAAPFMIQEIIPGEDSCLFGYLAFWDGEGRERAWVTKRKLRQYPPQFGDGSLQVTVEAPQVVELSRRLIRAFDYRGFVGVEFKFDARDESYRLIEMNPRTVSGNQIAISAGVDFPWIAFQYLTGGELALESTTPGRRPVKYVNEEWDIQAFLALRKLGMLNLRGWFGSLRHAQAKAFWAWDDPLPALAGLARFARWLLTAEPSKGPTRSRANPPQVGR